MSWFTKVSTFLTPFLVVTHASAARIQFQGTDASSQLDAHTVVSRGDAKSVEIRLQIDGLDLQNEEGGFASVQIKGLSPLAVAGNPDLLTTGKLVAVPEGFEPELEVIHQTTREIANVVPRPAQRKYRCNVGSVGMAFNSALYNSGSVYPTASVRLEEVGRMAGVRLVRLALNPVQVDLGRKALIVTNDVLARVHLRQVRRASAVRVPMTFASLIGAVAVNGNALGNHVRVDTAERMLVVTADTLKDALAPLIEWKRSKGIGVDVVTYADAGGTKEKVKDYIKKFYDAATVKPTYLLVAGNKTTAPAFAESTSNGAAASDWRFAIVAGDDNIPDMLYGRILADNADEAKLQVSRLVAHERKPEAKDWYAKAFTIASSESGPAGVSDKEYGNMVQAGLKAGTFKEFDTFLQKDKNATPENIQAALAKGRSYIAYFGHGSGTAWASTNGFFDIAKVAGVMNPEQLPVIIDVACLNADWVKIGKPFGKAWVTHSNAGKNAGAVAFYGGSVSISWDPPAVMSVGIAKYHFEKAIHNLGGTVLAGQLYLIEKMGMNDDTLENLQWYNLFGDPSLVMRTDMPKQYAVKVYVDRVGDDLEISIRALDGAENGVMGLTAAVAAGKEPLAASKTDKTGAAVLKLTGLVALEPNTVLTVSGYNAQTHEMKLE